MQKINKIIVLLISLVVITTSSITVLAANNQEHEVICPGKIMVIGSAISDSTNEVGYWCDVTGDGVRMRSTPYIRNNNIIRTLYRGDRLWVYQSGINVANNDGYQWSYVQHIASGTWGYVASRYFATNSVAGIDNPFLETE